MIVRRQYNSRLKWVALISMGCFFAVAGKAHAKDPFESASPASLSFPSLVKVLRSNLHGWTKLLLNQTTLWTADDFYRNERSHAKAWLGKVSELSYCQPDKAWKSFPVLAAESEAISDSFEQVALHPEYAPTMQLAYSQTIVFNGKARNVSYQYQQNGAQVSIVCSAANEVGDRQSIRQNFNIQNPKAFTVEQTKNGKLLAL